ncbi:MAG: abortive infection protein [Cenarchaeum symbiont of Oopsacas minuta]|nr:abortive infection protein [Cenarchaeum symbiont of Oopsacas minuta]
MTADEKAIKSFRSEIQKICDDEGLTLDRAFPRWICEHILGITKSDVISEAVSIGGKNDYGIDIFHINEDEDNQYVCWIQAKYGEMLDRSIDRDGIISFGNTIKYLENCPNQANKTFKQKSDEFKKIIHDNADIKKRMIYVVTGKLNEQAKEQITRDDWKKNFTGYQSPIEFELFEMDKILSYVRKPHTPLIKIEYDGSVIERKDDLTNKKSVTGYVSAKNIVNIVEKHHATLFFENPRNTLGLTSTNKEILKTLSNNELKKSFWKLNNGVTGICSNFKKIYDDPRSYEIDNFKVVNGRQTTSTLEKFKGELEDVFLLITIHETKDDDERDRISQATNTQNPIKPVDLITNFQELRDLEMECNNQFSKFYFERQTKGLADMSIKKEITPRRILEKEETARCYYAYAIDPRLAIMPDKDLFTKKLTLFAGESHFDKVFKDRKIKELIIPHIFMNMIVALLKEYQRKFKDDEDNEDYSKYKWLLSKKLVKYYILRFINKAMEDIEQSKRTTIENNIIQIFSKLEKNEELPDIFLDIAKKGLEFFIMCYKLTWWYNYPKDLVKKIEDPNRPEKREDLPSAADIVRVLKMQENVSSSIFENRLTIIKAAGKDQIKDRLSKLEDWK